VSIVVVREKCCERERILILYDLQLGAKINPASGCAGREDREKRREKEREIFKLSADRTVCFHLIYYKRSSVDIDLGRG
jgi:hypothetical protein